MELLFVVERETKNMVRFAEVPDEYNEVAVGTLYVTKKTVAELKKNREKLEIKLVFEKGD
jgi:hypothetical protein